MTLKKPRASLKVVTFEKSIRTLNMWSDENQRFILVAVCKEQPH